MFEARLYVAKIGKCLHGEEVWVEVGCVSTSNAVLWDLSQTKPIRG